MRTRIKKNGVTMNIQLPAAAVNSAGPDLGQPTTAFLMKLNLLENPADKVTLFKTPLSLQVITAGSTTMSKTIATIIASLGGSAAIWAAIKGFWIAQPENQRLAYIGAATIIVSAVIIGLAVLVRADLQARATTMSAEYMARAQTATAFVRAAQQTSGAHYLVKRKGKSGWLDVKCFETDPARGFVAVIDGDQGDRVPLKEIEALSQLTENGSR
jgi:fructose-1-phosphate kinase PfkB-like protein